MKAYVATRGSQMNGRRVYIGDLVPEAAGFPTLRMLLSGGYLEAQDVTEGEFRAAVEKFCADDAEAVLTAVGLPVEKKPAKQSKKQPAEPAASE